MKRWGILFSGQGAQKTAMGLDCYENDTRFQRVIDAASEVLSLDLLSILKNEHNELSKTEFVQPSLVAVSLGFYAMLQADCKDLNLQAMVGLSLGEYTALIASQKLSFEEGMRLLKVRAQAMQADSLKNKSTMVALVKPIDITEIEKLCHQISANDQDLVQIANYNSPQQIVAGGTISGIEKLVTAVEQKKLANKIVALKVNGAFHTPLYQDTSNILEKHLNKIHFKDSSIPVLSNTTGKPFKTDQLADTLAQQVISSTHFQTCMQTMIKDYDVNAVVEIGAGKTLSTFTRQIDSSLERERITNYRTYAKFIEKAGEK